MRTWWRRWLRPELGRLRADGRPAALWALRITVAAVASFVTAAVIFPGTQALLAPLTAMLVVQVTPVSLLARGVERVVAVVAGVALAVVFADFVPLDWWSLGVLILVAILIGYLLRLRSYLMEVAISAMLVLGVGSLSADSAAWQRITQTLVGAAVGVVLNLLVPPKVTAPDAGRAIDGLADSLSELLNRAADDLDAMADDPGAAGSTARGWLGEARLIAHSVPRVGAALERAEESRRLNVRAVGTPDMGPGLRQGMEAIEHATVSIRGMFRAVADATYDASWLDDPDAGKVLQRLSRTFRALARGIDAFGQLVRDEADPTTRMAAADVRTLQEALTGLHQAADRIENALSSGGTSGGLELHAALLSTVKRLLHEMDLDERVRRQVRLMRRPVRPWLRPRGPAGLPDGPEPSPEAETQVLPAVRGERRRRPLP